MKKLLILIFLISLNPSFSQESIEFGGTALYKKYIDIDLEELKSNPEDKLIYESTKTLIENLKEINYSLKFNSNESIFKLVGKLDSDFNTEYKIATLVGGGKGTYYINEKENVVIHEKSSFGSDFLVTDKLDDIKWEIGDEVKLVGKYSCLKATTKVKMHTRRGGVKIEKVVAWFCPKLNFSTGPIGFGGLPGLILELHKGKFIYIYNELTLDKPPKKLKRPNKGKKITGKDFLNISKEASFKR